MLAIDRIADIAGEVMSRVAFVCRQRSVAAIGMARGNRVDAFWYRGRVNFGDLITPALLWKAGLSPVHADVEIASLVSTGSVLQVVPETFRGLIVGSGLITDVSRRFPDAQVLGVRGEMTRQLINASPSTVLGDPGLLGHLLINDRRPPTNILGVIPHYVDKPDPRIASWMKRFGRDARLIDVEREPAAVIEDMSTCSYVISSSLHGLICADALGIPSAWMRLSERVIGGGFKFADYNSALGSHHEPKSISGDETLSLVLRWMREVPSSVPSVQASLRAMFQAIRARHK